MASTVRHTIGTSGLQAGENATRLQAGQAEWRDRP